VAGFVFWVSHMEEHLHDLNAENPEVRRVLGWARGEFIVPEDFDEPLPADVEDCFYRSVEDRGEESKFPRAYAWGYGVWDLDA
jgi:hypothetical protein